MHTKYGFEDGDLVPPDCYEVSEVYLRVMNRLLEKHGSAVRLAAYDRGGVHNPCLILLVPAALHDPVRALDGTSLRGVTFDEPDPDAAYDAALDEVSELEEATGVSLDFVVVQATISPELDDFLAGLSPSPDPVRSGEERAAGPPVDLVPWPTEAGVRGDPAGPAETGLRFGGRGGPRGHHR